MTYYGTLIKIAVVMECLGADLPMHQTGVTGTYRKNTLVSTFVYIKLFMWLGKIR